MADTSTERQIVLVGKIGAGKSATGNTVLMRKRFPIRDRTEEFKLCQSFSKATKKTYMVLDTPGIGPENDDIMQVGFAVQEAILHNCLSPHVFLLVVDPDDGTDIVELVGLLQQWFGMSVVDHMILVFTKGTRYKSDRDLRLFSGDGERIELAKMFGRRITRIENHGEGRSKFQRELLKMIESTTFDGRVSFTLNIKPMFYFRSLRIEVTDGQELASYLDERSTPDDIHDDEDSKFSNELSSDQSDDLDYMYLGAKPKVPIHVKTTPGTVAVRRSPSPPQVEKKKRPLMQRDVHRTIGCAYDAGRAVSNMKNAPLTSLTQLALLASDERNVEAVRNVVNSDEVQEFVEKTASFVECAVTAFGQFVTEVAQEYERNKRARELQERQRGYRY